MRAAARRCRCAQVTGKPILFMGTGEKPEALEAFQPERMASRILGMGDVLSLVEQVDAAGRPRARPRSSPRKVAKGKDFDLEDLHDQLRADRRRWAAWRR